MSNKKYNPNLQMISKSTNKKIFGWAHSDTPSRRRGLRYSDAGFTLIEVLTAIFVILVGVVGVLAIIQQTIAFAALSSSRLAASYLAQEGIEIVRNIRDGNWLEEVNWDIGLGGGEYEADYDDSDLSSYQDRYLYIDGTNGFYKYITTPASGDIQTKFKRKITITSDMDGATPRLKVSVLIEWQQIGKPHQVTAQEYLYNWR